jgi:hypothetical protein
VVVDDIRVASEIIDGHQGSLKVKSRQAADCSGTVFTLLFPCEL